MISVFGIRITTTDEIEAIKKHEHNQAMTLLIEVLGKALDGHDKIILGPNAIWASTLNEPTTIIGNDIVVCDCIFNASNDNTCLTNLDMESFVNKAYGAQSGVLKG